MHLGPLYYQSIAIGSFTTSHLVASYKTYNRRWVSWPGPCRKVIGKAHVRFYHIKPVLNLFHPNFLFLTYKHIYSCCRFPLWSLMSDSPPLTTPAFGSFDLFVTIVLALLSEPLIKDFQSTNSLWYTTSRCIRSSISDMWCHQCHVTAMFHPMSGDTCHPFSALSDPWKCRIHLPCAYHVATSWWHQLPRGLYWNQSLIAMHPMWGERKGLTWPGFGSNSFSKPF